MNVEASVRTIHIMERCFTESQRSSALYCCAGESDVISNRWRKSGLTHNCVVDSSIQRIAQNINGNQSNLKL